MQAYARGNKDPAVETAKINYISANPHCPQPLDSNAYQASCRPYHTLQCTSAMGEKAPNVLVDYKCNRRACVDHTAL